MEATEVVRIVGIYGMGGIGKTTIARVLFNRIAHKFQGSSFVADVRENSSGKRDMCMLQQRILKNIIGELHGYQIEDRDQGAEIIQERCCKKKVLLVLDDVNDVKQLEFLAATREWFGPGSRIIITTRDQHLLSYANADDNYKPALLPMDQAVELFCRHAFRRSSPPDGYMDLTNRAINYTRRLPLALKVLGSYLCGRQAGVWGSALDTLAKIPSGEVLDTMKLSFDSLNGLEKQIFLDIACFYKGEDVDDVTRILDSFGFDPVIGISVLVEKSLITISSNNRLDMHDLIQEMGWKVVEESAPNSRLWQHEKIYDVIRKNRELELIEGIVVPWRCKVGLEYSMSVDVFQRTKNLRLLDCYRKFTCGKPTFLPYESKQRLGADVFKSMKNLRLLCCEGKFTCRKPTFLPDELRWFCWEYYPFSSLPAVAHMSKLVGLEVIYGRIEHLWKGKKIMLQNLKFINLKSCESLKRFPDVSGAPNIERLDLSLCENLVEVDESVGSLKKLVELNMIWCLKLKCLPSMLHMESLEILLLRDCWSLKRIPEFSPCMVKVSHLDFSYCRIITEVPSSIKYLSNLSYLNLEICHGLKNIPNSIWELKRLNTLHFSFSLMKLPDEFQSIKSLEELHIKIPGSIIDLQALTNFSSLRKLHLHGNTADNDFPEDLHGLSSLEQLYITENSTLIHLPESISHLSGLKHLQLVCCWGLKTIHGLPSGIQVLIAKGCKSLEKIEHLSKEYQCLYKIELLHCNKLIEDEENERYLDKILEQSLEELSMIMECRDQIGLKVLPVFYHVDPSDVRKQTGDFATAFETHENKFKGEMIKVNKWRKSLTAAANLSGQHIMPEYGGESAFINKIVQDILADKQPRSGSRENRLIGIKPRIDKLVSLLKMEKTEEVLSVGIWGMGGIGKTTIARALFKSIAINFEGSSFVKDVRENSEKHVCALQEKILKDILGACHEFKIEDPEDGAEMIRERCCNKKVLLVLDDVNDVKQLEFLAATREWFGPGSRIIITTRDQHLLSYANADDKYKPALLLTDQALELFSRHAFRTSSPPDGYMDLTNRAINYTRRLPLALKVLGSFLCGREASVWGSALDTLAKTPSGEVLDTLKLSFDSLNDLEKQIFLDIACFYKGHDVQRVTRILDSFGFDPVIVISVLVEKSLITISSNNRLDMHDLIQEMGWKVVEKSAPNSRLLQLEKIHDLIGKRKNPNSWLWHLEKMYDLIRKTKNWELEVIEGIVVPRIQISQGFGFSPHVFESMKKLRILEVKSYFTWFKPSFLPKELRWFCWREYPYSSVPIAHMSKVVGVEMERGKITHLWQGKKIMLQNMKFINLKECDCLTRFPDVSGAPNIEILDLSHCRNMVEVDESLGSLKKLVKLDMTWCLKLKCLPSMLHMESLETLILIHCESLKIIPEFSPCMIKLSHINVRNCYKIEEVPLSIKYLSNLSKLNLQSCGSLKNIDPNSICELKCLNLSGCRNLQKFLDDFQSMKSLEMLSVDSQKSIDLRDLTNFSSLRELRLHGNFGDNDFPKNLRGLFSLEELHITWNTTLTQLPESISHLSSLKHLQLDNCWGLQTIHGLPPGIQVLTAYYCKSLEKIEDLTQKYESLYNLRISDCPKLIKDEENEIYLDKMLEQYFLEKWAAVDGCVSINIPRSDIPSWFKEQQDGCRMTLKLPPNWQT